MCNNVKHRKFVTIGSTLRYDVIYHPLSILNIWRRGGLTALREVETDKYCSIAESFGGIRPLSASKSIFVDLTTFEFRDRRGVSLN